MISKLKHFISTIILGGVTVILPAVLTIMVFNWLFKKINLALTPITQVIVNKWGGTEIIADLIVITFILGLCFVVGIFERTSLGKFFINGLDKLLLKKIPGYTIIKETVAQFIGNNESPFSSVAIVNLFGSSTRATAFVTDRHEDGTFTVFIPTGPNPTSGQIYHLDSKDVELVDYPVEATMRSIISCGAGSKKLLKTLKS